MRYFSLIACLTLVPLCYAVPPQLHGGIPPQAPPPPQVSPEFVAHTIASQCPPSCDCGCHDGQPCTCTHRKPDTYTYTHGYTDREGWTWNANTGRWWKLVPSHGADCGETTRTLPHLPTIQPQTPIPPMILPTFYYQHIPQVTFPQTRPLFSPMMFSGGGGFRGGACRS